MAKPLFPKSRSPPWVIPRLHPALQLGVDDPKGVFQAQQFHDSVIPRLLPQGEEILGLMPGLPRVSVHGFSSCSIQWHSREKPPGKNGNIQQQHSLNPRVPPGMPAWECWKSPCSGWVQVPLPKLRNEMQFPSFGDIQPILNFP